jgi:hypothetical protein
MKRLKPIIFSCTVCVVILFMCYKSSLDLMISISANTEYIKYKVKRKSISAISIYDFKANSKIYACRDIGKEINYALIEPGLNSEIIYKYSGEHLAIYITDKGNASYIVFNDGYRCKLPEKITFISNKRGRDISNNNPLPIAGPGQLGIEIGAQAINKNEDLDDLSMNLLHGGNMQIFGRAMGFSKNNKTLFPIKDGNYEILQGTRLSSERENSSKETSSYNDDSLYGFALTSDNYLTVSLTTESNVLRLFRPGRSGDSEIISVGIYSQLFNDPRVAWVSIILLTFTISFQIWNFLFGDSLNTTRVLSSIDNNSKNLIKLNRIVKSIFSKFF